MRQERHEPGRGAADLRGRHFDRILIVKPTSLGDVLHTVPVLVKLRACYPQARIDWLLSPALAELLRHHPALSNVVPFDRHAFAQKGRRRVAARDLWKLLREVRATRYELIVDLHGQLLSALIGVLSGAKVRIGFDRSRRSTVRDHSRTLPRNAYRYGWTGAREGSWLAYTHRIVQPTLDAHAVDRYLWLDQLLALDRGLPSLDLSWSVAASERVEALLRNRGIQGRRFALLVPGTTWETKHWPAERFAQVGRDLRAKGFEVVLSGALDERATCAAVAAVCPGVVDLSGETTVSELAALMQQAEICVSNDSGSMHLAVALRRPVVSVFGPTDPLWIGPYRLPQQVVRTAVPCAPCYLKKLSRCPHSHACMTGVSPEMVLDRVEQTLRQGDRRM